MKICLVRPPTFLGTESYPLNIGSLAAVLTNAFHQVILIDGELIANRIIESKNKTNKLIKLRDRLFLEYYVKNIEPIVDGFFSDNYLLWDTIIDRILSCHPDLIGFSCYTASMSSTKAIISRLKDKYRVDIPIILGGIHPTAAPEETLTQLPGADIAVLGEGEHTLIDLVKALENKENLENVEGICFRKDGSIVFTKPRPMEKDLATLPLTNFDFAKPEYTDYVLLTSRGCPFNCDFCASNLMWGRRVRFRRPEDVAKEVTILRKRGIKTIRFGDDTFTLNLRHIRGISDALRSADIHDVKFSVGSRIDTIDEEKLSILKEMGTYHISFGVETGSPRIMNKINKKVNVHRVIPMIKMVNDLGITSHTFFIINHPEENRKDMMATLSLINKLIKLCKLNTVSLNTGFPYPGTKWWTYCMERSLISQINIYELSHKYNHQQTLAINMTSEPLATVMDMHRKINKKVLLHSVSVRLKKMLKMIIRDPQRVIRKFSLHP